jgi:hypothetical protein
LGRIPRRGYDILKPIFLENYRKGIVTVLYASYFDASGKSDVHRFFTVAGAGSTDEKWRLFEPEWKVALGREGVSQLHFADFAAGYGEYARWKNDKGRRSRFLRGLIAVARKYINKLFSITVDMSAWNLANEEYALEEHFFSPYAFAGMVAADQSVLWAKRRRVEDANLSVVFEDGDAGWEGLRNLCLKYLNIEPVRLPKKMACPCQIGDMLGWKTRITATNVLEPRMQVRPTEKMVLKELKSLDDLMFSPATQGLFTSRSLIRNCERFGVPKR